MEPRFGPRSRMTFASTTVGSLAFLQISFCAADCVGVTPYRILQLAEKCDWLAKIRHFADVDTFASSAAKQWR
jgi:hypothetical protein